MLLTCLRLLGPATTGDGEALARAAEHVAGLQPDIRTLAETKKQRFVYLGSGPLEGLAHESALKMLELTAGEVVTYFDSPLGFRHGPKSALDGDTLAVVYVSTDPYTRRYDLDIIAEIRAQLGQDAVVVISTEPIPATHGPAFVLPGLDGLDDARVALPYLVFAQYLALFTALEHGKTPDNPFPSGEVNRVVQGVTIYPMAENGAVDMARYLGVDGGGSKTALALIDDAGGVIARATAPTSYYFNDGFDVVEKSLAQGVTDICAQAGIATGRYRRGVLRPSRLRRGQRRHRATRRRPRRRARPRPVQLRQRHGVWLGRVARRRGRHQRHQRNRVDDLRRAARRRPPGRRLG